MDINKLNYEAFAIDYLEGNLTADQKILFEAFMEAHPEVKDEMDAYLSAPLLSENEDLAYERKASSKKSESRPMWIWGTVLLALLMGWMLTTLDPDGQPTMEDSTSQVSPTPHKATTHQVDIQDQGQLVKQPTITEKIKEKSTEEQPAKMQVKTTESNPVPPTTPTSVQNTERQESRQEPLPMAAAPTPSALDPDVTSPLAPADRRVQPEMQPEVAQLDEQTTDLSPLELLPSLAHQGLDEEPRVVEMSVVYNRTDKQKKRAGWKKLLLPANYKNINLADAITTLDLKSAVEDARQSMVPELLITK